jgi:riboflavin kinase/FMN adenylyltransferase
MRIFHSLSELPAFRRPMLTQGTFDGVHTGHRIILDRVRALAETEDGESVVLTFFPHPRLVLFPHDESLKLLSTLPEKAALLEDAGISNLIVLPFTEHFSRLSPEDFARQVLHEAIGVHTMVVGYDHRFGRGREGDFHALHGFAQYLGFRVEEIPAQWVDQVAVSSTKIRNALAEGNIHEANRLLGRPYNVGGHIVHGLKLGRQLGYPTANLQPDEPYKLIPAHGVYAVTVQVQGRRFKGMANIGLNPAVPGKGFSIEAHLFDFSGNLYEIAASFEFHAFLRAERNFDHLESLKAQLHEDREKALEALAHL